MEFRKSRARIEAFFAHLDRHHVFHYNQRTPDVLDSYVHILMNMEYLMFMEDEKPRYEGVEKVTVADIQRGLLLESELCTCHFVKDHKEEREATKRTREEVVANYVGIHPANAPPGKTSKKGKGGQQTYQRKTQPEIKKKQVETRKARAEALKKLQADRKQETMQRLKVLEKKKKKK